jgi:lysyl-tRNA synthetase class II
MRGRLSDCNLKLFNYYKKYFDYCLTPLNNNYLFGSFPFSFNKNKSAVMSKQQQQQQQQQLNKFNESYYNCMLPYGSYFNTTTTISTFHLNNNNNNNNTQLDQIQTVNNREQITRRRESCSFYEIGNSRSSSCKK